MSQLALFDQGTPQQMWTVRDIWTPAWNLAVNLAIITACSGKWLKLKDMAEVATLFGIKEIDPPFSMQVAYLADIGRLKVRYTKKTGTAEWIAA